MRSTPSALVLLSMLGLVALSAAPAFSWTPVPDAMTVGQQRGSADTPEELVQKAQKGDPEAQYTLGRMYERGQGVARDDRQAAAWFGKAAERGFAPAQHALGGIYVSGRGVPRDDVQSVVWYRKAADQGFAAAQTALGLRYASGSAGGARDPAMGAAWFGRAAEQGDAQAAVLLAAMYADGRGVPQDPAQAVALYGQAAARGGASGTAALHTLGLMYKDAQGVPKDHAEALKWFGLEATMAPRMRRADLASSMRSFALTMTREQVIEAQARATAWANGAGRQALPAGGVDLGALLGLNGEGLPVVYRIGNGVTAPKLRKDVKPLYTEGATRARISGKTLLTCVVNVDGRVSDCEVARSLDDMYGLDEAALKAGSQWQFKPGTLDGQPVPVLVTLELAFTLR